jgi:hypothetical protein
MVSVSITTIPPRVKNKHLFKFFDSILEQTIEVNKIYVNLPYNYKRFDNLTEKQINKIKNYSNKIEITFNKIDSPILKYIGALDKIPDDELLFIGDDDQEYHPELLEKMKMGIFDKSAVYQNRYHIVKTGTAGIIHGFVGLMFKKSLLNDIFNIINFDKDIWIDDQLLSIYFYKRNIPIYPTIINDFDEIYKTLNYNGMEKHGTGGDLSTDNETSNRNKQIKELELEYNIFFINKNNSNGKGKIIDVEKSFYEKPINIHFIILDKMTKANQQNILNLMEKYPHFNFNLWNSQEYNKYFDLKLSTDTLLNYYTDKLATIKIKEEGGIYINRNLYITKDFDLYNYIFNKQNVFINNNIIEVIKGSKGELINI